MSDLRSLVLFDFDGTITNRDSFVEFIRFSCTKKKLIAGSIKFLPDLVLMKMGLKEPGTVKQKLIAYFFDNTTLQEFDAKCSSFCKRKLPQLLRPHALKILRSYLDDSTSKVVIVSASIENWIHPWANELGIQVIATRLEVKDMRLTGYFSTPNCNGLEKENRIRKEFNLSEFNKIIAYGDTRGDDKMLAMADEPHYRSFN